MSKSPDFHRWTQEELKALYEWMKEREAVMRQFNVKKKSAEFGVCPRALTAVMYRLRNRF
jgi:hypothetical protein